MPSPTDTTEEPDSGLILLVEDNPNVMAARRQFFNSMGLTAIGATTRDAALREVRNTPGITLVATDIDLSGGGDAIPNLDGMELARNIRDIRSKLPIVAYTAHESELFIRAVDGKLFDRFFPKARGTDEQIKIADECKKLASQYKSMISLDAKMLLESLQRKYSIPEYEVSVLRRLLPETSLPATDADHELGADELLKRAGYSLRMIEAGQQVEIEDGKTMTTNAPILIWLKNEGKDVVIAEMHGHPCIYAAGEDEQSAISSIVQLMHGYYRDLTEVDETQAAEKLSGEVAALKVAFDKIFID